MSSRQGGGGALSVFSAHSITESITKRPCRRVIFCFFLADSVRCRCVFPLDRSISPLKQQPLLKVHSTLTQRHRRHRGAPGQRVHGFSMIGARYLRRPARRQSRRNTQRQGKAAAVGAKRRRKRKPLRSRAERSARSACGATAHTLQSAGNFFNFSRIAIF